MPLLLDSGAALTDGSTWQTALLERMSVVMQSVLNEFGIAVQVVFAPTNGPQSYEKAALMIQVENRDSCDWTKGNVKFGVGADIRALIGGGTQCGQVHGLYVEAGTLPGSDGEVQAVEFGCNNNSDPKPYGQPGAKGVVTVVAGEYPGNKNATCGIAIVPGHAKFVDGAITVERASCVPGSAVFRLIDNATGNDSFAVMEDGTVRYTKLEQIT